MDAKGILCRRELCGARIHDSARRASHREVKQHCWEHHAHGAHVKPLLVVPWFTGSSGATQHEEDDRDATKLATDELSTLVDTTSSSSVHTQMPSFGAARGNVKKRSCTSRS